MALNTNMWNMVPNWMCVPKRISYWFPLSSDITSNKINQQGRCQEVFRSMIFDLLPTFFISSGSGWTGGQWRTIFSPCCSASIHLSSSPGNKCSRISCTGNATQCVLHYVIVLLLGMQTRAVTNYYFHYWFICLVL